MSASQTVRITAGTKTKCNTYPDDVPNVVAYGSGWSFYLYSPLPDAAEFTEDELRAVEDFAAAVAEWAADVARLAARSANLPALDEAVTA